MEVRSVDSNTIQNIVSQPPITLRTMPNEFGIPKFSVKAWESTMKIAGWEAGNIFRMKYKALQKGDIAIQTDIKLKFEWVGGQLVAVAGESRATIRDRERPFESILPQVNIESPEEKIKEEIDKDFEKILEEFAKELSPTSGDGEISIEEATPKVAKIVNLAQRFTNGASKPNLRAENIKSEATRIFMLAQAGVISESQFNRKVQELENSLRTIGAGDKSIVNTFA